MRYMLAVTAMVLPLITGCDAITGPESSEPGETAQLVLEPAAFQRWAWAPNGSEIVFTTRFDYPYTGPRTRIEAVNVLTRQRRLIVPAPADGRHIIGTRFHLDGEHIYYEEFAPDHLGNARLMRARLNGSAPEFVAEFVPHPAPVPAPGGRALARIERGAVVVLDLETGRTRAFPIADREGIYSVAWSSDGKSVIAVQDGWRATGISLEWFNAADGTAHRFTAPAALTFEANPALIRQLAWNSGSPVLYAMLGGTAVRYDLATGQRTDLGPVPVPQNEGLMWSPDFRQISYWRRECLKQERGLFGMVCVKATQTLIQFDLSTGTEKRLLEIDTRDLSEVIPSGGGFSEDGRFLAFYRGNGSGGTTAGDGVYVMSIKN